jgi:hypothetical protein
MAGEVVAGLFATPGRAMTVQKELHRIGLTDSNVDVGRPGPGPYRLEVREAESLGRGILDGIVVGTILGAVIGALLMVVAVPGAMERGASAILLGILMGGFWGSFFGGLGGMAIAAAANDDEAGWCELPDQGTTVLVIARAGADANAARTVMRRCGATALVRATPNLLVADSQMAPVRTVPAGPGHLSLEGPSRSLDTVGVGAAAIETRSSDDRAPDREVQVPQLSDQVRAIGIPRGAFLLLLIFLIALSGLWANVYLRVLWRA